MMRRLSLLTLALVTLSACAPDVVEKPVQVEVPVSVPCKTQPVSPPAWATSGITPKNSLFEQMRALEATNEQRKAYEVKLQAAIKACE